MAGRTFEQIKQSIAADVLAVETPGDLATLMIFGITLHSAIRICMEADIFQQLVKSPSALTAAELTRAIPGPINGEASTDLGKDAHPAKEEFISRLLRGVVGLKLVDEVSSPSSNSGAQGSNDGAVRYVANDMTRTMANPDFQAGMRLFSQTLLGPRSTMSEVVEWATGRTEKDGPSFTAPDVHNDGPLQRAFGIAGTSTFDHWTHTSPHTMNDLSSFMKWYRRGQLKWWEWLPVEVIFGGSNESDNSTATKTATRDRVSIVDVGGNLGYDMNAVAKHFPDHKMRLVVQDQPAVIARTKTEQLDPRIELQEHNFFSAQPLKGAKTYVLRKVLHDWPDKQSVEILSQLRDAMAADSRILVNDMVLPDQGAPIMLSVFDIGMMALLSGRERSEAMWKKLIDSVDGLEIHKFWQSPGGKGDGVVEIITTA